MEDFRLCCKRKSDKKMQSLILDIRVEHGSL